MILLLIYNYNKLSKKQLKINENNQKGEKLNKMDNYNSQKAVKNQKKGMSKAIDIPQY